MAHSTFSYIGLKAAITIFRAIGPATNLGAVNPDDKFTYKSRDKIRDLQVHIYRPQTPKWPSPILINLHGGGFVVPLHGSDDVFCRQVATDAGYVVLDADYAVAPEQPFPTALHDVEDLILHVLGKPDEYDSKNIAVSGFSAGGNLALAALVDAESGIPKGAIRNLIAFYPIVDISKPRENKEAPEGSVGGPPPMVASLFQSCYLPPGNDLRDPRISPALADPASFPDNILLLTAGMDKLAPEVEEFAKKLESKRVIMSRMQGVGHGFDKEPKKDSKEAERTQQAYGLAVKFLMDSLK